MNTEVMFSSQSDEWATPQNIFDELHQEFHFDIDICATEQNKKLPDFLSKEIDCLNVDWKLLGQINYDKDLTVFMNPPYSKCEEFIKKAYEESLRGVTTVALVPSRTCTIWFHSYCYQKPNVEIRFRKGRIRFVGAKNGAPFPSMIVIFKGQK